MKLVQNWSELYVPDDYYRNPFRKEDVVFLLQKYMVKGNGMAPTRAELKKLSRKTLTQIWFKNSPTFRDLTHSQHQEEKCHAA